MSILTLELQLLEEKAIKKHEISKGAKDFKKKSAHVECYG